MAAAGYNVGDDDSDQFGRQVLPIAILPEDFDGEPLDGAQYLFTVRRNARSLPNTTRAHNPYQLPEAVLPPPPGSVANSDLLPSQEWLQLCEARFRNMRENMHQPTVHVGPALGVGVLIPPSMDRILWWAFFQGEPQDVWHPNKRSKRHEKRLARQGGQGSERGDREPPLKKARIDQRPEKLLEAGRNGDDSHAVVVPPAQESEEAEEGEIEEGEVSNQIIVFTEDGEPAEQGPSESAGPSNGHTAKELTPREVTTALLSRLEPKQHLQLIRSFTFWIGHQPPSHGHHTHPLPSTSASAERYFPVGATHARWIFGLLSTLDTHLTGDETHILRELARSILGLIMDRLEQRAKAKARLTKEEQDQAKDEDESLAPWWINVALIVSVWGQRDLWSDAEDMVRRIQS